MVSLKPIADGRLLTEQALKAKLVDTVGYKDDLIKQIREDVQEELMIVRCKRPRPLLNSSWVIVLIRFLIESLGGSLWAVSATYVYPGD